MIRKKGVCFNEVSSCLVMIISIVVEMIEVSAIGQYVEGSDLSSFGDRENVDNFPRRRKYTSRVRKLKKSLMNKGMSSGHWM